MIFRNFILENFPFLEDDFDSLTDYELFCKMIGYVKTLVKDNEDFRKQLEDLENYIYNLNLQDEVNNKLDEMAEDGTLENIISQYIELMTTYTYNNVADMKNATNLVDGCSAKTLGYYNVNDAGESYYKIRHITNEDVVDNSFIIALHDTSLVAELLYKKAININQLGANNITDTSPYINKTLEKEIETINFNKQDYIFNESIIINKKINLEFNQANCEYIGNDYLFYIQTNFRNKVTINNLKITGTDTNNFIDAKIDDNWGCSFNLYNSDISKFDNILNGKNIFNCRFVNNVFNSNKGKFIINADDMSNNNLFENCYIKSYNTDSTQYPTYKFILTNVKNLKFISCAFEQYNTLFSLTNCSHITLSNCETEQQNKIANTFQGLNIDHTNMIIGINEYSDNIPYQITPRAKLTPYEINLGDISAAQLRYNLLVNNTQFGLNEVCYVRNTNGNSAKLYELTNKFWDMWIPFNLISNKGENVNQLITSVSKIFSEQSNEVTLLTIYTYCAGTDGGRVIFKTEYVCENNTTLRKIGQTKIFDNTWNSAEVHDVTLTETLTQYNLTLDTSKTCFKLTTKIKWDKLGEKFN